jgi:secondary thiamine-phosphate synthase enzyme
MFKDIKDFKVSTRARCQLIEITSEIRKCVKESGVSEGICYIFVPHTTAGVTINENADRSVRDDILMGIEKIVPEKGEYTHLEGNSPAHIKASLIGSSETVFIKHSELVLGTWQGIYFCEFDGPRERRVLVKVIGK